MILTIDSLTHIFCIFILKRDFVALKKPQYETHHLNSDHIGRDLFAIICGRDAKTRF
jgi:hypothetical protein